VTMTAAKFSEIVREVWHPLAMLPSSEEVVRMHDYLPRPRFLYLTKVYAEWLGIEVGPVTLRRNQGVGFRSEGGTLPVLDASRWAEGFQFEGWLYGREFHGSFRVIGVGMARNDGPHAHYLYPVHLN
jgi:hypothetical protein